MALLIPGLIQHLHECLSNKRHGLLKAIEGEAKAFLAVGNLCLLLLHQRSHQWRSHVAQVDHICILLCVSLCGILCLCDARTCVVYTWYHSFSTWSLRSYLSNALRRSRDCSNNRMTFIEFVVSLETPAVCIALLFMMARERPTPSLCLFSHLCGYLSLFTGSWSVYRYLNASKHDPTTYCIDLLYPTTTFRVLEKSLFICFICKCLFM